jgi:hypothetical protein
VALAMMAEIILLGVMALKGAEEIGTHDNQPSMPPSYLPAAFVTHRSYRGLTGTGPMIIFGICWVAFVLLLMVV